MKFTTEQIRNISFPSGTRGYKRRDVEDFLSYVVRDYHSFEQRIKELEKAVQTEETRLTAQKEASEKQTELYQVQLKQKNQEVFELKQQLDRALMGTLHQEDEVDQQKLLLSQKIAMSLEEQAEARAKEIVKEAENYHAQVVTKLRKQEEQVGKGLKEGTRRLRENERLVGISLSLIQEEVVKMSSYLDESYRAIQNELTTTTEES
ncbi:hypothetical protein IGI37_003220 [Enterococcus sp. AZ194]|uniref:DivIVA domain-containing protein n=1 Tax=Enterococcus sp. AZ194 TaxID=2774629 RepID=UPI003F2698CD